MGAAPYTVDDPFGKICAPNKTENCEPESIYGI